MSLSTVSCMHHIYRKAHNTTEYGSQHMSYRQTEIEGTNGHVPNLEVLDIESEVPNMTYHQHNLVHLVLILCTHCFILFCHFESALYHSRFVSGYGMQIFHLVIDSLGLKRREITNIMSSL